jgi:hypothetical protein
MRLVNIILVGSFFAVVLVLVLVYKPAADPSRVSALDQAMEITPSRAPTAQSDSSTGVAAPQSSPDVPSPTDAAPSEALALVPDAEATLKAEHERETATQFDRALLFLAPAAPAPMIEQPIATAAAAPALATSTEITNVPDEARTWRGAVLVPKDMLLATAHTSKVRIPRIEAHPLDDGNVRIWARIQNPSGHSIEIGVACTFRFAGQIAGVSRGFLEVVIPPAGYYDADFLSPRAGVETYTILVRSLE